LAWALLGLVQERTAEEAGIVEQDEVEQKKSADQNDVVQRGVSLDQQDQDQKEEKLKKPAEAGQTVRAEVLPLFKDLAAAYALFEDTPGLAEQARYERARCLWRAGLAEEARKRFLAYHESALSQGRIPPIDGAFRAALLEGKG